MNRDSHLRQTACTRHRTSSPWITCHKEEAEQAEVNSGFSSQFSEPKKDGSSVFGTEMEVTRGGAAGRLSFSVCEIRLLGGCIILCCYYGGLYLFTAKIAFVNSTEDSAEEKKTRET